MKTERRHELATNELADWIGDAIERIKPYSTAITGTIVACGVLALAYLVYSRNSARTAQESWNEYIAAFDQQNTEALREAADKYPSTMAGKWSRLSLADALLSKGVQQLFEDHDAAEESLGQAVDDYTAVIQSAPQGLQGALLAERATFALGEAYESLGKLEEAREQYRAVQTKWPEGAFAGQATTRLADLDRGVTREFYDWFATQHPEPKKTEKPGSKPSFGVGDLDLDKSPLVDGAAPDKTKAKAKQGDDSLLDDSPLKSILGEPKRKAKPLESDKEGEPAENASEAKEDAAGADAAKPDEPKSDDADEPSTSEGAPQQPETDAAQNQQNALFQPALADFLPGGVP